MIFEKVHIIISHPVGNSTFSSRINYFRKSLKDSNYKVFVPVIKYPFKTKFQGISYNKNNLEKNYLISVYPKTNWIQKVVLIIQRLHLPYFLIKLLYSLNILLYKIDLWYIPLYKNYLINSSDHNIILGSGGPGSVFLMSYQLAKKYNAKLILDYRDPWNFGYNLLETGKVVNKFKRMFTINNELQCLKKAEHIITVSESLKSFFPKEFQEKISVIENGSNYEFKEIKDKINPKPQEFNLVYLGTIYNDQLLDETLFKAVMEFIELHKITNGSFKIYFLGSKLNSKLAEVISKYNLESFTIVTERLDEEEVLSYLLNASMFLHLKYGSRSQIITSKNADYLLFKKPILLPKTDNGDLAESITKYNAGYICNGLEDSLKTLNAEYSKFLKKEKITLDNGDFSFMSRSEISKKLITIIKNLEN